MPSKKKLIVNARKLKARKCLDTNSDVHNGTDSEIEVTALQDPRKKKKIIEAPLFPNPSASNLRLVRVSDFLAQVPIRHQTQDRLQSSGWVQNVSSCLHKTSRMSYNQKNRVIYRATPM